MNYYWAYVHRDDRKRIRVKILFSPYDLNNDLYSAIQEQASGNDFIYLIVTNPISADNIIDAEKAVMRWFVAHGHFYDHALGWCYNNTKIEQETENPSRFANIKFE